MKRTILIALLFVFKLAVTQTNDHSAVIKSSADKIDQKVIDWSHDIHQNPEFLLDDSSFKTGVVAFCNLVFNYEEMDTK